MANQEHLDILNQGVDVWNRWREEHPDIRPDLSKVHLPWEDLTGVDFSETDLTHAYLYETKFLKANLSGANLSHSHLYKANFVDAELQDAVLSEAELVKADFIQADLNGAILKNAHLNWADFSFANLMDVDMSGANLNWANLSEARLNSANLTGCSIYAISAWNVDLEDAIQLNLVITRPNEPTITVDNLEVAQFIYLLLNNNKIRHVIDSITSKVVLILGRFSPERKAILDALREELRKHNYTPVLFDFEKPSSRDVTETVSILAHLARFVIADITDAKSIPQELKTIVPNVPSVPVQPLILNSQHEYGMFEHFTRFPWVLPVYRYTDEIGLLQSLTEKVIVPAEQKAKGYSPTN